MKNLGKLVALGAALAVSAISAHATPITGGMTIQGINDTWTSTGITFTGNGTVANATGSLAPFDGFSAGLTSFTFANSNNVVLFDSPAGFPGMDFTINGAVDVVNDTSTFLNVTGNGTFLEIGHDPTSGTFTLTSTANGLTSFTIDSGVAATPEPSSLMLLGTGLTGAAGLLFRRRRSIA